MHPVSDDRTICPLQQRILAAIAGPEDRGHLDIGDMAMIKTAQLIALAIAAIAALIGAANGEDALFRAHSGIFFIILAICPFVLLHRPAPPSNSQSQTDYMDAPIRYGAIATLFWGIVGFLVGIMIAAQLAWPDLNIEPWFNFGRLRPLHTSVVIFAFGGNALLCTSLYVVQRTCHTRLFGGDLVWFTFWGYTIKILNMMPEPREIRLTLAGIPDGRMILPGAKDDLLQETLNALRLADFSRTAKPEIS
jgi:hypothetical protein